VSAANGGLVPLSTSDTVQIKPAVMRLYRLRKSIRYSAELFNESRAGKPAMLTLTYDSDDDWHKYHVTGLIKCIREYMRRCGHPLRYCWVAELTKRGRVHYHVLLWLPRGVTLPKPDKRGWWPHGSTRIEWAKCAVGYLVKYASKMKSKYDEGQGFPKGLRLHATGGLDEFQRELRSHHMLPKWIREQTTPLDKIRRPSEPGIGGFLSKATGEHWSSPWVLDSFRFVLGEGPIITVARLGA